MSKMILETGGTNITPAILAAIFSIIIAILTITIAIIKVSMDYSKNKTIITDLTTQVINLKTEVTQKDNEYEIKFKELYDFRFQSNALITKLDTKLEQMDKTIREQFAIINQKLDKKE